MKKKYLFDFEVEAHACLEKGLEKIVSTNSIDGYEIHISNLQVDRGVDRPLLSIQIVVPGDDIKKIEKVGISKLKEYLHYLSFVSNVSFRIHKLIRIIDWTPGEKERKYIQFERFPDDELPYPILDKELFKTIETLQNAQINMAFKRALKWFSNGIGAESIDDQFQYFWLVIELLAQLYKKPGKVNDLCPKCRKPLFCEECDEYPTHRPYPKQAIQQLFEQIIKDSPQDFFDITNDIRNALFHGDSIEEIENNKNIELSSIVDKLGLAAWVSIFNIFKKSLNDVPKDEKLQFIKTNMYANKILTAELHLGTNTKDPDNPKLSEFPKPKINLIYSDDNKQKLNKDNSADQTKSTTD